MGRNNSGFFFLHSCYRITKGASLFKKQRILCYRIYIKERIHYSCGARKNRRVLPHLFLIFSTAALPFAPCIRHRRRSRRHPTSNARRSHNPPGWYCSAHLNENKKQPPKRWLFLFLHVAPKKISDVKFPIALLCYIRFCSDKSLKISL